MESKKYDKADMEMGSTIEKENRSTMPTQRETGRNLITLQTD